MATDKAIAERLRACFSAVADARVKPMFGEYGVYAEEKMIGQINGNRLFVKETPFGGGYAPELEKAPLILAQSRRLSCRNKSGQTPSGCAGLSPRRAAP